MFNWPVKSMVILLIAVLMSTIGHAQAEGGQFCVRAFDDRNGSGTYDGGEPFLTRGVSAQLLDDGGVVVASALLENSPTAANGVICFTGLAYGQYQLEVTSADFNATTPTTMTASIVEGQLPTVFDFGAQRIAAEIPAASSVVTPEAARSLLLERALIALAAAAAVLVVMALLGFIVYLLAFRGKAQKTIPEHYMSPRVTTGSHPAVRSSDTGEYPRI